MSPYFLNLSQPLFEQEGRCSVFRCKQFNRLVLTAMEPQLAWIYFSMASDIVDLSEV